MLQDLAAVLSGKIDVENHENRTGRRIVLVCSVEKPHRLFSVFHYMKVGLDLRGLDRLTNEKHVRWIVLDDQDLRARDRLPFRSGG
jgi:hypothetical protein